MTGSGQLGSVLINLGLVGNGNSWSSAAAWLETKWSGSGLTLLGLFGIWYFENGLPSLSVRVGPMTLLYCDRSQLPFAGGPKQLSRTFCVGTLSNTFAPWDMRV